MKILIVTPLFPPEKVYPAQHSKILAESLSNIHDITVLTQSRYPEELSAGKVVHVNKNMGIVFRFLDSLFKNVSVVKKQDLVIIYQAGFTSFISMIFAKILGKYVVCKMRQDESEAKQNKFGESGSKLYLYLIDLIQSYVLSRSDLVIFHNSEIYEKISKKYKLNFKNYEILAHPEPVELLPIDDYQIVRENFLKEVSEYQQFLENKFVKKI